MESGIPFFGCELQSDSTAQQWNEDGSVRPGGTTGTEKQWQESREHAPRKETAHESAMGLSGRALARAVNRRIAHAPAGFSPTGAGQESPGQRPGKSTCPN